MSCRRPAIASLLVLGAAWGLAESVWFFVVPDVLVTFVALRCGLRAALAVGLAAALAAPLGGAWLYRLAAEDPAAATTWLASVPFVGPALIARGMAAMAEPFWPLAMLKGSVTGVPYKIFAAGAGAERLPLVLFLALSVPIRFARYAAAALAVVLAARLAGTRLGPAGRTVALAAFWILFYGQFWWRMAA